MYCFMGTPLCYSAFAFGIDQPGLINIGFYGSSMKSNTFEQHSFQANQSVVCGLQIFLKYIPRRAPVAFRTWWGHQYRVGIICSPQLIQVAAIIWWRLIPMSPCPQARKLKQVPRYRLITNCECFAYLLTQFIHNPFRKIAHLWPIWSVAT